jgi:hypothetical protein
LRLLPFGNCPIGSTLREARLPRAAAQGSFLRLKRQGLILTRLATMGQGEGAHSGFRLVFNQIDTIFDSKGRRHQTFRQRVAFGSSSAQNSVIAILFHVS